MSENIVSIFPANDFSIVAENASKEITVGITIGYNSDGDLCVYGGGMLEGRQPTAKDFLWMVETFKHNLVDGVYSADD